jgi:hypothetical protein
MQCFKSLDSIRAATLPEQHRCLVRQLFQQLQSIYAEEPLSLGNSADSGYQPDIHGFIVYLEAGDDESSSLQLSALNLSLAFSDLPFEGGQYYPEFDCFELILVLNNDFALTFIIPNADWLQPKTKALLLALLGDSDET